MASTQSSLAEANRQHWNKMASQYDVKEWQKVMLHYITSQIQEHADFFGIEKDQDSGRKPNIRLLDYACGTGNVSKALCTFVTSCLGIDISPNMVSMFNSKASDTRLDTSAFHAVVGNLFDAEPYIVDDKSGEKINGQDFLDDPKFKDFDICIVGLGFHHFENFVRCLEILSERVKKGGVVGIVDLLPKEGHAESLPQHMQAMMHISGFTEETITGHMKEAGLVDIEFMELPEKVYMEIQGSKTERAIFFARGRRPSS